MEVHREFAYQKKIIFALRNIKYNKSSPKLSHTLSNHGIALSNTLTVEK